MDIKNKVAIVTGGASGIGKALCERFAKEGARAVVMADLDEAGAQTVASTIGGLGLGVNVASEAEMQQLVQTATEPEAAAIAVVDAMREERFLVLPHADMLTFLQRKTADYDRWLRGMRRLRAKVMETVAG